MNKFINSKKSSYFLLLLVGIILVTCIPSFARANSDEILTIPISEIGLSQLINKDTSGPMSFCVDNQKLFCVLDNENNRVLKCKDNTIISTISYPYEIGGIDIAVNQNGDMYILTVEALYVINNLGDIVEKNIIPKIESNKFELNIVDTKIQGFYKPRFIDIESDVPHITFENYKKYKFDFGELITYESQIDVKLGNNQPYMKDKKSVQINLEISSDAVSIRHIKTDKNNYEYIELIENYVSNGESKIYTTIRVISNNKLNSVAEIKNNYIYVPNKYIYITDDGEIYQMLTEQKKLSIEKVNMKNKYTKVKGDASITESQTEIPIAPYAIRTSFQSLYKWNVGQSASCYTEGDSYWVYNSTYNNNKNVTGDPNEVTQPRFFAALGLNDGQDHEMEGLIPYCWGGSDWPGDVNNKTAKRSPDHLWYAGNIDGKYSDGTNHPFISYTTGVDCSGFISNIFRLPNRLDTLALMNPNISPFRKVGTGLWKNGEYGDILLKDSHVMFIWGYNTVNGQITGTYVEESTTRSSLDKVGNNFWGATYCSQFQVYRYHYWLD